MSSDLVFFYAIFAKTSNLRRKCNKSYERLLSEDSEYYPEFVYISFRLEVRAF